MEKVKVKNDREVHTVEWTWAEKKRKKKQDKRAPWRKQVRCPEESRDSLVSQVSRRLYAFSLFLFLKFLSEKDTSYACLWALIFFLLFYIDCYWGFQLISISLLIKLWIFQIFVLVPFKNFCLLCWSFHSNPNSFGCKFHLTVYLYSLGYKTFQKVIFWKFLSRVHPFKFIWSMVTVSYDVWGLPYHFEFHISYVLYKNLHI